MKFYKEFNEEKDVLTFDEFEHEISYGDTTAFVYFDGVQKMTDVSEITCDSVHSFAETTNRIHIANMNELPEIKELMRAELLSAFEPAKNVEDEGYDNMVKSFDENKGQIAWCTYNGVTTYMLIW